jgi:hypothetical protein
VEPATNVGDSGGTSAVMLLLPVAVTGSLKGGCASFLSIRVPALF